MPILSITVGNSSRLENGYLGSVININIKVNGNVEIHISMLRRPRFYPFL
jgi:hypothetical protein